MSCLSWTRTSCCGVFLRSGRSKVVVMLCPECHKKMRELPSGRWACENCKSRREEGIKQSSIDNYVQKVKDGIIVVDDG